MHVAGVCTHLRTAYPHDEQVEMLAITEMGEPTRKRSALPVEPAGLRVWTIGSTIVIGGAVADAGRMMLPAVRCARKVATPA